ncbi:PP2C family protein-serine/threonine phosphatase [Streptomyces sp. NBC_00828]|uniref:PP2C family protein-serine/threonine phosphatase n=1 Tax=Streptomyces sp. NBC_00828 TaxID=2903678 RepID=UPI00387053E5
MAATGGGGEGDGGDESWPEDATRPARMLPAQPGIERPARRRLPTQLDIEKRARRRLSTWPGVEKRASGFKNQAPGFKNRARRRLSVPLAAEWRARWLLPAPLIACLLIAVPDLLVSRVPPLVTLLLIGPLLACVSFGVRHTVVVCCWSAALGLAMGIGDGSVPGLDFGVQWSGLLLGCALTVYAARQRERLTMTLAQTREVARITQEAILRPISRTLDGTQVHTRYHCAARESTVGGDLYDVAVTPYGLRVLVGDVRGHGLDAVRLTAETIAGFRELAYTAPTLTALTGALDARLTPELGPEDFVTAVFAEFAPGEVRLVNCGHPPPLRSGHRVEFLEPLVPTPPLGLRPEPRQYRVRLQPGDRLLLYTDGLTEARDPEGTPFPVLGEAALALREPLPQEALHTLYARLTAHTGTTLTDDLALVLCQPAASTIPVRVP